MNVYEKPADQWTDDELLAAETDRARELWGERTPAEIRTQLKIFQRLPKDSEPGFRPGQFCPLRGIRRPREEEVGGVEAVYSNDGEILPDTPKVAAAAAPEIVDLGNS